MMAEAMILLAVRLGLDFVVDQRLAKRLLAVPGETPSSDVTSNLLAAAAGFGVAYRILILVKINFPLVAIARILRKNRPVKECRQLLGYRICLLTILLELHAILQLALSLAVIADMDNMVRYQSVRHWSTLAVQLCSATIMVLHSWPGSIKASLTRLETFFLRIRDLSARHKDIEHGTVDSIGLATLSV